MSKIRAFALLFAAQLAIMGLVATAVPTEAEAAVVRQDALFHTAKTTAQDIFSTSFSSYSGYPSTALRITVVLESTNAVLNFRATDGTDTVVGALNNGTALTAGQVYTFVLGLAATKDGTTALSYNFRIGTNTTIGYMLVEQVTGDAL